MAIGTIVINDDLRTMQIPSSITLLGVESDDDVNVIQFQMPKEYSGFDLSTFQARVNYLNAGGIGDVYIADDLTVDGDNMTFTWLVGRSACAYVGMVNFIVCLRKFDEDGNVVQEYNTTVYKLPVLQGLETTELVVQQYPDIIKHILQMIEDAGGIDLSNYYTKTQVNALIPSKLPNPYALTINGTEYNGSEAVDMTIEASFEEMATISGQILHVVDAIPQAVESLVAYDTNDDPIASVGIAVSNKNLFRLDLIASSVTDKGITFAKNADGAITVSGTSTGANAETSCTLDPHMFVVGNTYTLSSGKTIGFSFVQLTIDYTDNTSEVIVARNSAATFTISKAVSSVTGAVVVASSGQTISNEVVYAQLELSDYATTFAINIYSSMTYDGTVMPVLPAAISNVWATDNNVASLTMEYESDTELSKIYDYVSENMINMPAGNTITALYDGHGTVSIGIR